ncbi:MAG TPA: SDR family oxidoreductase [Gemmatimonadales bacterium]|nr:SDR family oxidoreductase [Gemmatimonadales bacterium]
MRARLQDRVIVVTGAANGIGNALALALVAEGAALVLVDIDADGLGALRAAFNGDGAQVIVVRADVRQVAELEGLARQAVRTFGRVDAVVNCAGVLVPGAIDTCPAEDITYQLDTNLGGTINVTRTFVPQFKRQGSGHLILIASLAGVVPIPGESIYAASKFAVRGFAHSIAHELRGTGVSVTVVCPDSTRTRMLDIEACDPGSSLSFSSPAMEPEEVAGAIIGALKAPRLEVTVPGFRGRLIRWLGAMPTFFGWIYPLLDAMSRRRKARYYEALHRRRIRSRSGEAAFAPSAVEP